MRVALLEGVVIHRDFADTSNNAGNYLPFEHLLTLGMANSAKISVWGMMQGRIKGPVSHDSGVRSRRPVGTSPGHTTQ
jgi:hypothetical protein